MRKTIEFIRKYWTIGKEIILVLAAVLYFIIGFRIAPLVTRIDAIESQSELDHQTFNAFMESTNKRFESNEATIKSLSDSYLVSRSDIKNIKYTVDQILKLHLK